MTLAEIILRVGSAIGGWLIFIGHALTLAVIPEADCDPASDQLWRGTLVLGALAGLGVLFAGQGFAWSPWLRWLAVTAALLAVYAGARILPGLPATSLDGQSLCALAGYSGDALAGTRASLLERSWTPFQLGVLALGLLQAVRYWLAAARLAGDGTAERDRRA